MQSVLNMRTVNEERSPAFGFGEVAREYQGMMLIYARTLLRDEGQAQEVVQEALVAAWRNLERFDVTRDIGAWLRGIIRNKWKDLCRKEGRKPEFAQADLEYLESQMISFADRSDIFDDLADCREKLPEEMRDAVTLSYDEGFSSEDVGKKLGLAAATVRKRLERARALLRDCLRRTTNTEQRSC